MVNDTAPSSRASKPVTRPARTRPSPLAGSAMASSRSATFSRRPGLEFIKGAFFKCSTYRPGIEADKQWRRNFSANGVPALNRPGRALGSRQTGARIHLMHVRPLLAAFAFIALAAPAHAQSRLPMEGFADLAERLTPAVVNIATSQRVESGAETPRFPPGSPLERFNQGLAENSQVTSLGSGFLISADGVVVTNNHVIAEADTIEVILQNDQHYPASVVGRDPATDIAVLRVHARG